MTESAVPLAAIDYRRWCHPLFGPFLDLWVALLPFAATGAAVIVKVSMEEIAVLAGRLKDEEFNRHELVQLLLAHGSRAWEDSPL